jgi:hypothetical protein
MSPHPPPSGAPSPQGEGFEQSDKLKFEELLQKKRQPELPLLIMRW